MYVIRATSVTEGNGYVYPSNAIGQNINHAKTFFTASGAEDYAKAFRRRKPSFAFEVVGK